VQRGGAGDVPVTIDVEAGRATMQQLPAEVGTEVTDRGVVTAGAGLEPADIIDGLPIVPISTGIAHTMVPVRDDPALRRAVRDDRGTARACEIADAESLYLFTIRGDGDVRARMFDKGSTIGEDPATGSAAGPLGVYLAMHGLAGMPGTAIIAQGEQVGRPSFLHVDVSPQGESWSIHVGGGVSPMGEGAFEV
jgi:PhzF family phenazine biosynthesis protein